MAWDDMPADAKYAVFKMTDALSVSDGYITFKTDGAIPDAVVIRRQDFFASPALATYASCIALVAQREADPKAKAELLAISDYFEHQAQLAADEGHKLPTL